MIKLSTVDLLIDKSPVIEAFLWFELAYSFTTFSWIRSYIMMPASSVVMKAFLSMIAISESFFPKGTVFGNRKLLILHQLRQSPWSETNYLSFILINLQFLSLWPLYFTVSFLNLLNSGWKYFISFKSELYYVLFRIAAIWYYFLAKIGMSTWVLFSSNFLKIVLHEASVSAICTLNLLYISKFGLIPFIVK